MERRIIFSLVIVLMLVMMACSHAANLPPPVAQPIGWPTTWTGLSTDPDDGGCKDHRDVVALYYAADSQYLYLRMETVTAPGWNSTGPQDEARYKCWFDTNGTAAYVHGTTVDDAEFLLILEDLTDNSNDPNTTRDQLGELTLMDDLNNDGFTKRWDQANPPNYTINNPQTAPTGNSSWWRRVLGNGTPGVGGPQGVMGADIGYRIDNDATGGKFVDMYVSWAALGNPSSLCLIWATDNQDNNLDQAPNLDRPVGTSCISVCVPPQAAFNATPTSGCAPLIVNFTDQSTGNITSWSWIFGDGGTSTLQNPSHEYASAGSYNVTLNVTTVCGSDNETKANYITVGPGSIGDLVWADLDRDGTKDSGEDGVANITVCLISGSDSRTIIATTETDDNGYYLFPNLEAGAYIVDVNQKDDDMPDDYFSTTYNEPMNTSLAACEHFLDADFGYAPPELGIIGDYVWDDANGDGVQDDGETGIPRVTVILRDESGQTVLNVTETDSWGTYHFYDVEAGSYNVTIDLDDPDLGDYVPTTSTWVEAVIASNDLDADFGLALCEAPTAAFNAMPTSGCAPLTVNFTDQSTGSPTSWNWTFGDGGTSTDQNPSHQYANAGSYNITLTVSNACGSDDETKVVTVHALLTWYHDADGDGYGNATASQQACSQPPGYVLDNTDCNDNNANVHPGAMEVCNGIDDDCDTQIDEGVTTIWYQDSDGDNYGNPAVSQQACSQPSGYVSDNTDCNDSDKTIYPGAPELCDGKDNDCDSSIDEGVKNTYYLDSDSDGYGDPAVSTQACSAPAGYVSDNTDCDDSNAAVHPWATEVCNSIDDDCDGSIDEGVKNTYYLDSDSDGYGDPAVSTQACSAPAGYVADNTDCDDSNASVHPGAKEVCNGIDDDCDNLIDEGSTTTISGTIRANGAPLAGVLVTGIIHSPWTDTDTSDGDGKYTLTGVPCGACNITITATLAGYTFSPQTRAVTGPMMSSVGDQDFNANFTPGSTYNPGCCSCSGLVISSTEGGSVTTPGEGTFPYLPIGVVNLVASPDAGYKFVNWSGDVATIADIYAAETTITMNGDYSITANFEEVPPSPAYPTVTTQTATIITTNSAILNMNYTMGNLSQVEVCFAYKKSTDSAWSYTAWVSKTAAGTHAEVLTGLDSDTKYDFKAQLKGSATVEGTTLQFTTDKSSTSPSSGGGVCGCFIATAAYGTPTAKQIDVLREFRDSVLLESNAGSQFVALYYQLSPPVAEFIGGNEFLRTLVRELLVDPIVWVVEATGDIWRN